jgi:hypothetical protein
LCAGLAVVAAYEDHGVGARVGSDPKSGINIGGNQSVPGMGGSRLTKSDRDRVAGICACRKN